MLKQVAFLRAAEPPRISGVEALQIVGSSMFMLKEEHNKLISQFLAEAAKLPAHSGVRLFVEGSPLANLPLYILIESCGVTVVAVDNCWGNRYSDTPINTTIDPLEAIIGRYQNKSSCPYVFFPAALRADYCQNKAVESKARGVVFYISEWDPSQIWDYPEQKKVLETKGIPTVCFMHQKYLVSDAKPLEAGIEQFVGSIGA